MRTLSLLLIFAAVAAAQDQSSPSARTRLCWTPAFYACTPRRAVSSLAGPSNPSRRLTVSLSYSCAQAARAEAEPLRVQHGHRQNARAALAGTTAQGRRGTSQPGGESPPGTPAHQRRRLYRLPAFAGRQTDPRHPVRQTVLRWIAKRAKSEPSSTGDGAVVDPKFSPRRKLHRLRARA